MSFRSSSCKQTQMLCCEQTSRSPLCQRHLPINSVVSHHSGPRKTLQAEAAAAQRGRRGHISARPHLDKRLMIGRAALWETLAGSVWWRFMRSRSGQGRVLIYQSYLDDHLTSGFFLASFFKILLILPLHDIWGYLTTVVFFFEWLFFLVLFLFHQYCITPNLSLRKYF